jgi:transcriptional regulator with XRE-family HTH domain
MNALRQLRLSRGLSQPDLVAALKPLVSYIDHPTLSKYENSLANPIYKDACAIASYFGVDVGEIWPEYEYAGEAEIATADVVRRPEQADYITVKWAIPQFNPITRDELVRRTGLTDRAVRRYIQAAQFEGCKIINDGKGYRYARDDGEVRKYTEREYRRALTILAKRRAMLRKTEKPQVEGQMKLPMQIKNRAAGQSDAG